MIPNTLGRAYRAGELVEVLRDVDAIITGTDELTGEVIRSSGSLRAILKHGVGLDNVDLEAADERGIVVAATPGAMDDSVADHTIALLLALVRRVVPAHASVAAGEWRRFDGFDLRGRTLGLVGFGRIARAVCVRARAFGMEVVAHDPFAEPAFGVELVPLSGLLRRAEVVSLHAALPSGSVPLLGRQELRLMKPGAILVNTARGSLVDEDALVQALREGRLSGAALDVFTREPPFGSPLTELENVVLTPHLGGQTVDALRRMGEMTVANCLAALRGVAAPG